VTSSASEGRRIRKAVVPLAGWGTRLYPASSSVKKGLFPLVDRDGIAKPVIQLIVEEALECGVEEVCLVVGPDDEEDYRRHFKGLSPLARRAFAGKDWALRQSDVLAAMEERIHFAVQFMPRGYGDAVYQARQFVGAEPCLVMLGDHVYLPGPSDSEPARRCARQLLDVFEDFGAATSAVNVVGEEWLYNYGTVRGRKVASAPRSGTVYEVDEIVEKPSPAYARARLRSEGLPEGQYLCWFGLHAMTAGIFDCLGEMIGLGRPEEVQFTAAQEMLRQRERYLVAVIDGERHDTGDPPGLVETQLALALRSPLADAVSRQACARLDKASRAP
jgi:UTP--glucose-1-phosphate uridylyltransferase